MADISDVEQALVNLIASAVYPSGTTSPSAILTKSGTPTNCRVFPGWPVPARLDADVAAGLVNISVFAQPGLERNVTRYNQEWQDQTVGVPTMTAASDGTNVTLSGTITPGNYVTTVTNKVGFTYVVKTGDTLTSVAAGIAAAALVAGYLATVSGNVVTFFNRSDVVARVAAPGTIIRELKRQQRRFMITVWAPNNDLRVAASRLMDPILSATTFLTLADLTAARLIYELANDQDRSVKQSLLCRDNYWWVEYATTQVDVGYPITTGQVSLTTPTPQTVTSNI